ncbi:MAG: hypothetical protein IFK94_09405 [Acidobacteria bacterium]|uniref:Tetratricopeptide repeat protein n=1 Tax=Candidatus Polarisedimenticola svalbardensis TaxID=2886004 RepID=A0A8J6Y337_9BACT|nr:hypothetical protein [Candidatus Polarisedimenticola svalbardensis]
MLSHAAEASFQKGLDAFHAGRNIEAMALFEAAIELERRKGGSGLQPRYLSYYGVCLAVHADRAREGIYFCREAIAREGYNADLHLNHAKALLVADKRRDAHDSLIRGLSFQPGHREIRVLLKRMGIRKRPVLPFLERENVVNVKLGLITRAK